MSRNTNPLLADVEADPAVDAFYAALRDRRFELPWCEPCTRFLWPPRSFCPSCGSRDVAPRAAPPRGRLYAFSTQERSPRFSAPDVLGAVELPGVGKVLSRIAARYEELAIGQEVEMDFVEVEPGLVLHQFRPVAK